MAKSKASKQSVVVLGDVTLDWLEEAVPRSEPGDGDAPRNYELYPGFRWTPVWGGATLVERLLRSAVKARYGSEDAFRFDGVLQRLPHAKASGARKYLQSLALVKQMIADDGKPIRVDPFKGFTADPGKAAAIVSYATSAPSLACVVVDDAANGCRDDGGFVKNLTRLADKAPLVVVKLSRPLDRSVLMTALTTRLAGRRRRVVVVVNADDLRAQGVDISRRLSWERSAIDLISVSSDSSILRRLSQFGDVLVRFGNDGCITLERDGDRYLIFDPRRAEDAYDQQLTGTMPGATSAFVADIAAALLQPGALLRAAVPQALTASRRLLKLGFDIDKNTKQVVDYPLDIFRDDVAPDVKNEFKTVDLPPKGRNLGTWNILSNKLDRRPPKLAEKIVREGHEEHLDDVPLAQFGKLLLVDNREIEGYRSIENLLREYIKGRHGGKPKPLSVGVFGPPGSGKSFGIKEIAKCIKDAKITSWPFNLTQFEGPHDLVGAFHTARDETLKGNLPLLIFDEFDCAFGTIPWGWLKFFLAPMQDGEFEDDGQIHPLGNAIFVFAGGIAHSFAEFSKPKAALKNDFKNAKGPDFASRLKGYVDVQGVNPKPKRTKKAKAAPKVTKAKSETQVDPICVMRRAILLRSMLLEQEHRTRNMYPIIAGKHRFDIDDAVLDALLRVTEYRHGARCLESILMMSRLTDRDHFGVASLPSDAQLKLHVDDSFAEILKKHARNR